MKLREFKKIVDAACKRAGKAAEHADVEFWVGEDSCHEVEHIGQFSVVPDLVITLKPNL